MTQPGDLELVRSLYGWNWGSVVGQEDGLPRLARAFAADFVYDVRAIGKELHGLDEIQWFLQAIEEDFSELVQEAETFMRGPEHVVVLGTLRGKGRRSRVPFHTNFGHIWTLEDGLATRLEGHLDPDPRIVMAAVGQSSPSTEMPMLR